MTSCIAGEFGPEHRKLAVQHIGALMLLPTFTGTLLSAPRILLHKKEPDLLCTCRTAQLDSDSLRLWPQGPGNATGRLRAGGAAIQELPAPAGGGPQSGPQVRLLGARSHAAGTGSAEAAERPRQQLEHWAL